MLDGWTRPSSNGSMTMRPASISDRIVLSLSTTGPRVYSRTQVHSAGADTPLQRMRNMEGHDEQTHYVKRVLLPSGKTIEVVYFRESSPLDEAPDALRTAVDPADEPHQDLHLCLECSSDLVYPVQWEESGSENWSVLLHCPNCDVYREGIFTQDTVEVFDEELDRGADALARDYKRLMRANMAEEIDRFVGALTTGAILPEDFAPAA